MFSLFLSRILVFLFSSSSNEIYLHCLSYVKFYTGIFRKKNMIRKTSFLNHKSLCHPLKIFKLFNKREEQWNNVGETALIFTQIFREALVALARLLGMTKA